MAATVLAEFTVNGWQWGEAGTHEEEQLWLPNPYQAEADAQVLAGAWPGTPLLMGCGVQEAEACNWMALGVDPGDWQPLDDLSGLVLSPSSAEYVEAWDQEALATEYLSWEASPWSCLAGYCAVDEQTTAGSVSTFASTEDGEADIDATESAASGGEATLAEGIEGDEANSVAFASERPSQGGARCSRKLSHQCVPKRTDLGKRFGEDIERENITTLMVRNIPNTYTRAMLMEELNLLGFEGKYDFIYLPMDKSTQWNVGYAFVNFSSPAVAKRVIDEMTNYSFQRYDHGSGKVAQISIAHIQGLERNLEYYSSTAVQCARIPTYRPLVLGSGQGGGLAASEAAEAPQRAPRRGRRARQPWAEDFRGQSKSASKPWSGRAWAQDRRGHAFTM